MRSVEVERPSKGRSVTIENGSAVLESTKEGRNCELGLSRSELLPSSLRRMLSQQHER